MKQFSFFSLKLVVAALWVVFFCLGNAQHTFGQTEHLGSLHSLENGNGFKDIRLGAFTGEAYNHKFVFLDGDSHPDADSCFKYGCNDSTLLRLADNLSLDMVGVRTYKGRIVNIYLFFRMSDGYKVLSSFLSTYGMFTGRRDNYSDAYYWDTNRVNLKLLYAVKVDLGVAVFTLKSLQNEIDRRRSPKKDMILLTSGLV